MNAFIDLRISGQGLNHAEITSQIKVTPNHTFKKGDVVLSKVTGEETIHKEDTWIAGVECCSCDGESIEQALAGFLEKILPSAKYLSELACRHSITLWVSAYPEAEQINLHLSNKVIHILFEMGIALDFNVLFLKEFY